GLAVGDDSLDPERPARPQDSEGDPAAVGDEDLAEHQASLASPARSAARAVASSMTISSCPYSTAWPGSTRLAPTIPSAGATTSWGTPSTSTAPSRSPDRTRVPVFASGRGWKIPTAGEVARARWASGSTAAGRPPVPAGAAPVPPAGPLPFDEACAVPAPAFGRGPLRRPAWTLSGRAAVSWHAAQTSSRAGGSRSARPAGIDEMPDQRPGSSRFRRRSASPGRSGGGGGVASTSRNAPKPRKR